MSETVDFHVHLGHDFRSGYSLELEELIDIMNANDIAMAWVFACPYPESFTGNPYHSANLAVLKASEKYPDRIIPVQFVHPFLDTLDEVKTLSAEFRGFKLHGECGKNGYRYSELPTSKVATFLFSQGKRNIFHSGLSDHARGGGLAPIARTFPEAIFQVAHACRLQALDLNSLVAIPNVEIDLSPLAVMCANERFITTQQSRPQSVDCGKIESVVRYLITLFGKDRLRWGSDLPWCSNMLENGFLQEKRVLAYLQQ